VNSAPKVITPRQTALGLVRGSTPGTRLGIGKTPRARVALTGAFGPSTLKLQERRRTSVGSIYQPRLKSGKPSSVWWARYYVNGRKVRESSGSDDKKAARDF
jgi:hypothetical protein